MSVASGSASEREVRFQAVAAEYLEAREADRSEDLSALLARHPDLADEIAAFVAGQDEVAHLAAPLRDAVAPATWPEPTRLPGALGDFRILRELGRGGMGIVYEAEQVSLGRRVALKVLPFAATMDPRQLQRFHNEARAAAGLHHTNIVPVYAVGQERGVPYYAMQFIDGRTLADFIAEQRGGPPAPPVTESQAAAAAATVPPAAQATSAAPRDDAYFRRVAEWGIRAAEALDHAHTLGVVHRDVKPANLLIDAAGRLWVTDFGLAQVQSDARLTMTGDLVGTLRYMSPEQALAKRAVIDHRTDVYSLGATLYELLTLEPAFGGSDRQELLRQIAFEEPRPPRKVCRSVPAELEVIVLKAMEKNPQERYATAKELADDLRRWLDGRLIQARRPSVGQWLRKWARRHKPIVWAAAVCLLVTATALIASVGWVLSDRAARQREAEGRVRDALEAAEPGLRQGNPYDPALIAAVQRAEAQVDGGAVGPELQGRVRQLRRDVDMLERLAGIDQQPAGGGQDPSFDRIGQDRLYGEAFAWYGVDVTALSPEEAAERVRASAIRAHLTAGLDQWALVRDLSNKGGRALLPSELLLLSAPLRAVANLADDDPWRRRLRDAVGRPDRIALLKALAEEDEALRQPSATVDQLAAYLFTRNNRDRAAGMRLLRRTQESQPADFWINFQLANRLMEEEPPDLAEVMRFCQAALALRPQSAVSYHNLGAVLTRQGKYAEAAAAYRKALDLMPNYLIAYVGLGNALLGQGKPAEAAAAYREAIKVSPNYPEAYFSLGHALVKEGKPAEAEAACRQAIALKPDLAEAHNNLGVALNNQGKWAEAEAACRQAVALNPNNAQAHNNLGLALRNQGKWAEAEAACREAIKLRPRYPEAYCGLGHALLKEGKPAEAEVACRQAIALKPDWLSHFNLGLLLMRKGDADGAIACWRKAIALKKDCAGAHFNLGTALRGKGQFAEALTELRRGHALGSKMPGWPSDSEQSIKECERLAALDAKLPRVLKGEVEPADADERLALAQLCQLPCKSLFATAVRFYAGAFSERPALAEKPSSNSPGIRYEAACCAALAGCGQGQDARDLPDKVRLGLRHQALTWLRIDLAACRRLLERQPDKFGPEVRKRLQHWQQDPDLNGVRGPAALARLPETERAAWQTLWADVADTLARAGKATPGKK